MSRGRRIRRNEQGGGAEPLQALQALQALDCSPQRSIEASGPLGLVSSWAEPCLTSLIGAMAASDRACRAQEMPNGTAVEAVFSRRRSMQLEPTRSPPAAARRVLPMCGLLLCSRPCLPGPAWPACHPARLEPVTAGEATSPRWPRALDPVSRRATSKMARRAPGPPNGDRGLVRREGKGGGQLRRNTWHAVLRESPSFW